MPKNTSLVRPLDTDERQACLASLLVVSPKGLNFELQFSNMFPMFPNHFWYTKIGYKLLVVLVLAFVNPFFTLNIPGLLGQIYQKFLSGAQKMLPEWSRIWIYSACWNILRRAAWHKLNISAKRRRRASFPHTVPTRVYMLPAHTFDSIPNFLPHPKSQLHSTIRNSSSLVSRKITIYFPRKSISAPSNTIIFNTSSSKDIQRVPSIAESLK